MRVGPIGAHYGGSPVCNPANSRNGFFPSVIRPEESMAAVQACLAAESSATTGKIVRVEDVE